jgi:macrolide transport system ATP-binding/permease protein
VATDTPSPLCSLEDVRFSYKNRETGVQTPVLKGISLACFRGELIAIQGPSGSGKSTLLYLLGGMLTPDAGTVHFQGRELTCLPDFELAAIRGRNIGFVFQQFHLLPRASVLDNILLPTSYISQPSTEELLAWKTKARSIAERLGLGDQLEKRPNQMSGGQQQRVAIARALLMNAPLILADEPTGNLDTENSREVMQILRTEARSGKTVVVITHEPEIAALCDRTIPIRDGRIEGPLDEFKPAPLSLEGRTSAPKIGRRPPVWIELLRKMPPMVPLAWENLLRTRLRTALTLVGVTIGIAAVLSMLTLGSFVRDRILGGYEALGVNKLVISGYPNWELKATDPVPAVFKAFDPEKEISSLRRIFPEIRRISPVYVSWRDTVDYGGNEFSGARTHGVDVEYAEISNRKVARGTWLLPSHIVNRSPVCVLGSDIAERLFPKGGGVGEVVHVVTASGSDYTCRALGILESVQTNVEGQRPNEQLFIPSTFFPSVNGIWESSLRDIAIQLRPGGDVLGTGTALRGLFLSKYGTSGRFRINSDALLVAQMERFISSFRVLLISIAFLSLMVGGIGITNMMLVSVSERFREIGLRKAVGATRMDIRAQFLTESILVCSLAGLMGIAIGFFSCELIIYIGSNVIPTLEFAWVFNPIAWAVSAGATIAVGVLSGLAPALRAERLEVIEALRSE